MANIFQKGTKFAATALGLLTRAVKLPGLLTYKYTLADFQGAEGDVINVRRPPLLRARDKGWRNNNAIVVDDLVKSKIQVRLDQHPYSAVRLSSEEATLDEVSYVRDVQAPQVLALLEYFEFAIVKALRSAEFIYEVAFDPADSDALVKDPRKVALRARKYFQISHVPAGDRYWLVGADVSEAVAGYEKLEDVDTSGLPEALREGVVGRLRGFTIIEVDALEPNESYFMHGTAVAMAVVAPVVPQGAAKGGGVAAGKGLAVTQVWDYDGDHLADRSVVHAFAGATPVEDPVVDPATGLIVLDGDEPRMEFVRAIRVVFEGESIAVDGTDVTENDTGTFTIAVTGTPTGGTFTLAVDGEETAALNHNASAATIQTAINALDGIEGATVTGTTTKTITFTEFVTLALGTNSLTGGSSPSVTVTEV